MRIRIRHTLAICSFIGSSLLALAAFAQPVSLEYQVKSSYLFNFMQFVKWPGDAFAADGKFNLCVVGAERFGTSLDALVGERVENHPIVLRRLDAPAQAQTSGCQLLFISAPPGSVPVDVPAQRGLLTVGESPGFLKHGGMINLVETKGRVRFEINQRAAEEAGLAVSSRLLSLAVK